ncbi:transposase [Kitasatospora sp. NPDC004240]
MGRPLTSCVVMPSRCTRAAKGRRTFAAVAKEIGVNHETLRNWVRAADAEPASTGQALSADERAELTRLRKAEREWQVEKEILRRAAAYFAREMR